MDNKKFKIISDGIKELVPPMGGCYATDSITVEGNKITVMIRDKQTYEGDSGWVFMSGLESQEYVDDHNNIMIYEVNTIANYDPAIIPYLNYPIGVSLERCINSDQFEVVED